MQQMQRSVQTTRRWVSRFRKMANPKSKEKKIRLNRRAPHKDLWKWGKKTFWHLLAKTPFYNPDQHKIRSVRPGEAKRNKIFRSKYPNNAIHTTKYGPITFLPKNLYEQFKRVANIWFLIVVIIQLIPGLSPLNPASSIVPLVFVLSVTAFKEAAEDVKRRLTDARVNHQKVQIFDNGQFTEKAWRKVRVGDILKIENNKDIPADIFIINTSNDDGICYVETANLDGETNLKVRQALEETVNVSSESDLAHWRGMVTVEYEKPNVELYNFEGTLKVDTGDIIPLNLEQTLWRGCTLRNTDWVTGVVLYTGMQTKVMKNSRRPPTKRSTLEISMNRALYSVFILALSIDFICGILAGGWATALGYDFWYLELDQIQSSAAIIGMEGFAGWLILLNVIIPLSLYVYLEMVKVVMVFWIDNDVTMYDKESNTRAKANTSNLAEDLGQIEYIFSDKTGTLTCNQMDFLKCSINGKVYGNSPYEEEVKLAASEKGKEKKGIDEGGKLHTPHMDEDGVDIEEPDAFIFEDKELLNDIQSSEAVADFFRLLALCNTVLVEKPEDKKESESEEEDVSLRESIGGADFADKYKITYQAASPDEAALVSAAQRLGFELCDRDTNHIWIKVHGEVEEWDLLNILEFNSDRKRMSVIVRDPRDGKVKLLCKGADSVIYERLAEGQDEMRQETLKDLEDFGTDGLRTLCLAARVIDDELYQSWNKSYYEASIQINGREEALARVSEEIETELQLLGATAIEDKLQDGVPEAIATLLKAGIKMWVLTGDKMETAINIGFSCSLLNNSMKKIVLSSEKVEDPRQKPIKDEESAIEELERNFLIHFPKAVKKGFKKKNYKASVEGLATPLLDEDEKSDFATEPQIPDYGEPDNEEFTTPEYATIIDGKALAQYLPPTGFTDLSARFLEFVMKCKVVICCRVSPLQKALVVKLVKRGIRATTLAIGDGANDVPMIQQAHIGVGISGKEGRQAVMASDYSIAQFRFLVPLLLVHGHWSYRRMCQMLLYSFYKNIVFSLSNLWFGFFSGFTALSIFDSWAVSIYNIFFTGLPILIVSIFDQANTREQLLMYPQLYKRGIEGKEFSTLKFWTWQSLGIYQSLIVTFFGVLAYYHDTTAHNGKILGLFAMGNTILTSIILVVNFKIFLMTNTWTIFNHIALWLSLLCWYVYLIFYQYIPSNIVISQNELYYLNNNMFSTALYWLLPLLCLATCCLPDLAYKYYQRMYRPQPYHIVQEISISEQKDETRLRRIRRRKFIRDKLNIKQLLRKRKNTGYAFSQAEGGSDLFYSLGMAPIPGLQENNDTPLLYDK